MTEFKGSSQYVVSDDLLRIVNISIALQKPLLIKGGAGTGKTMLADAIAEALGKKLIIWNIKSTTKAQDGLYVYDTVQRLYDSQFGGEGVDDIKTSSWASWGSLLRRRAGGLLIDEIDKADLEFPNDLLWELDQMEFYIPETKRPSPPSSGPSSSSPPTPREGAARRLPPPVHLPLHRLPQPGDDERHRHAHYPDIEDHLLDKGHGGLLPGAGACPRWPRSPPPRAAGLAPGPPPGRRGPEKKKELPYA